MILNVTLLFYIDWCEMPKNLIRVHIVHRVWGFLNIFFLAVDQSNGL